MALLHMPKLGLTMTEGIVAQWLVPPGASFRKGQPLYVLETEKVANEIEADTDGVLEQQLVAEGDTVPVGAPIAQWRPDAGVVVQPPPEGKPRIRLVPVVRDWVPEGAAASAHAEVDANTGTMAAGRTPGTPGGTGGASDGPADASDGIAGASDGIAGASRGRIIASPYARRLARDAGLDLARVTTTRARITAEDVRRALGIAQER